MIENRLIWLFLLVSQFVFSQIKGVVKDSISGEPIPYVNIWVESETIGTTSEPNGSFSLDIKEEKVLVFSALGYEVKKASSKTDIILLKPKVFELKEVVVSRPKRNKKIKINVFKKNKIKVFYGAGLNPTIIAKRIEPKEQIFKFPYLKEINFFTSCQISKAKIILRFFEIDDEGKPGNDLLDENIIIEVKKGELSNKLNLEKYNIRIPHEGFYIAFEWMIIDDNKHIFTYTLNEQVDKKITKKGMNYQPSIGTIPSDNSTSWQYSKGKWFRREKFEKDINVSDYQYKYGELAIELTLTN